MQGAAAASGVEEQIFVCAPVRAFVAGVICVMVLFVRAVSLFAVIETHSPAKGIRCCQTPRSSGINPSVGRKMM